MPTKTNIVTCNKVFDLEIVSIALAHQINTIAMVNAKDFDSFSEITVLSI